MSLHSGSSLGRYRIVSPLGAGGMGEVYRARDEELGRDVAIKVLPDRLAREASARERFEREARAVAALSHPNILTIFDFGTERSTAFAVTELLEGRNLRELLDESGALEPEQAVEIGLAVADGLAAAHEKGIVHRDIKPENLFLTETGQVKILDFGLARPTHAAFGSSAGTEAETMAMATTPGTVIGTLAYMSPEQARGETVGTPSDVFSLACVLFELLEGRGLFGKASKTETLAAVLRDEPEAITRPSGAPGAQLEHTLRLALAKEPRERTADAGQFAAQLRQVQQELRPGAVAAPSLLASLRRPKLALPLAVIGIAAVIFAVRWQSQLERGRWARDVAIPEVSRLIEERSFIEAYDLAVEAEAVLPETPLLERAWEILSTEVDVTTEPPGASVFFQRYENLEDAWRHVGETPLVGLRIPRGALRWRLELEGWETVEVARKTFPPQHMSAPFEGGRGLADAGYAEDPTALLDFELSKAGSLPDGMIAIEGGRVAALAIPGYGVGNTVEIERFHIARHEVTNSEYQEFVDQDGYERPELWKEPFVLDGRDLSFDEAMEHFVDSTGRTGPATWSLGRYPEKMGDHPVSGVSWYEASAYAEFRGWSLPTVFHWARAALPSIEALLSLTSEMIPQSNFSGEGAAPVGAYPAWSLGGARDMGGNVREWTSTAGGTGRFLLGGGWADPAYQIGNYRAHPPWERDPQNGFRCAHYPSRDGIAELFTPMENPPPVDLMAIEALPDAVLDADRTRLEYGSVPLNVTDHGSEENPRGWITGRVSFDALYGGERVDVRLHLPVEVEPPYQSVILFGGANVLQTSRADEALELELLDFVVQSGRVLVQPLWAGTFERNDGRTLERLRSPGGAQQYQDQWVQDLRRTIDYLETRADFDATRIGWLGVSYGASLPHLLREDLEPRLVAAVLLSGGLSSREEGAARRVATMHRVRLPFLMLNGRYDYVVPMETNQIPFFELAGTAPEHKRHVLFEGGHGGIPPNEMIRETLDWLDSYLGPVE